MVQGTTPRIYLQLPFDIENVEELWVTLAQSGKEKVTKVLEDVKNDSLGTFVELTQEDTLSFRSDLVIEIQLRLRLIGGIALASKAYRTTIGKILKDGVI